jgi:hypothetical protein
MANSQVVSIVSLEGDLSLFHDSVSRNRANHMQGLCGNEHQSKEKYFLYRVQLKDMLLILISYI